MIACGCSVALEPAAVAASQSAWQAGQPININVDYDGATPLAIGVAPGPGGVAPGVPASGALDEIREVTESQRVEKEIEGRQRWRPACFSAVSPHWQDQPSRPSAMSLRSFRFMRGMLGRGSAARGRAAAAGLALRSARRAHADATEADSRGVRLARSAASRCRAALGAAARRHGAAVRRGSSNERRRAACCRVFGAQQRCSGASEQAGLSWRAAWLGSVKPSRR